MYPEPGACAGPKWRLGQAPHWSDIYLCKEDPAAPLKEDGSLSVSAMCSSTSVHVWHGRDLSKDMLKDTEDKKGTHQYISVRPVAVTGELLQKFVKSFT